MGGFASSLAVNNVILDIPNGILARSDYFLIEKLRDPETTRTNILRVAFDEIHNSGFRGTSVNEIVAKTNVTKGAFFHYFPTKDDLGYAIVDVLKEMILQRWIRPLAAYKNPVQGMITRFRKIIETTSDEDMILGCPLNNLTQEMSSVDPVFREKLVAVMTLWIDETERYLKKAQRDGYLKPQVNPRQVAEFVVMVEEGSYALVKNLRDRRLYWSFHDSFKQFMASISEKPSMLSDD